MGEGRKSITLLEDSQALPARPYSSSSMKMELCSLTRLNTRDIWRRIKEDYNSEL